MKKDWTGNSTSVFKSIGATNHAEGETVFDKHTGRYKHKW